MAVVAEVSSVLAGGPELEEQLSAGPMDVQDAGHWALGHRNSGYVLSACQVSWARV